MNYFLTYLIVFAVGGLVCLIGQVIINLTKFTSARILVIFLLLGVLLETIGVFKYIKDFAQAGITIPIIGFGSNLAKGAIEGAQQDGLIGAFGRRSRSFGGRSGRSDICWFCGGFVCPI